MGLSILLASPGGGHGWFEPLKVFFPWAALFRPLTSTLIPAEYDLVSVVALGFLYLAPFPAYVIVFSYLSRRKPRLALVALLGLHLVLVAIAFTRPSL